MTRTCHLALPVSRSLEITQYPVIPGGAATANSELILITLGAWRPEPRKTDPLVRGEQERRTSGGVPGHHGDPAHRGGACGAPMCAGYAETGRRVGRLRGGAH